MKALDTLCTLLDRIASVVTGAVMIFLTILIGLNIIMRYIFNSPITWQYEATVFCLSWVVFIGMSITFRNDEHMRLTFVSNALPENKQNLWIVIMDVITLIFLIWAGYCSISVVQSTFGTVYQTIPISKGLFYLPFPIGCAFSVCHIINNSYKRLKGIPLNPAEEKED